jgi:hypothetical protein
MIKPGKIAILVLGCNMEWLQQDRVNAALKYYEKLNLDENRSKKDNAMG